MCASHCVCKDWRAVLWYTLVEEADGLSNVACPGECLVRKRMKGLILVEPCSCVFYVQV